MWRIVLILLKNEVCNISEEVLENMIFVYEYSVSSIMHESS